MLLEVRNTSQRGKLESSSSVTWRIIIPADSNINWTRIRAAVGSHKGRIEFRLIEDPNDIRAGIALNEKTAGLAFPNTTGNLDFNSGFRSSNLVFRKWCQDLFVFHWNRTEKKVPI